MSSRSDDETPPEVATYSNLEELTCALRKHFGDLGLPQLNDGDLALLDDAIAILNPSVTQVRVVEVDTFTESEHSIVRGDVDLSKGQYALSQKAIILERSARKIFSSTQQQQTSPATTDPGAVQLPLLKTMAKADASLVPASSATEPMKTVEATSADLAPAADSKVGDIESGVEMLGAAPGSTVAPAAGIAAGVEGEKGETPRNDIPEIFLFWARNRRRGGNLIVCPNVNAIDRLVQAYLVCEVVECSFQTASTRGSGSGRSNGTGGLLGVELGEALPSEQDELQGLLSNYSFTDASLGVVALAASVYYFGVKGENDVNVLTLLAVAVVAGLNQEATWPWVFNLILNCSQIRDPMVKVTQCKRVHNHTGQTSGQGVLTIGLAVFGVWIEVFNQHFQQDEQTPIIFRILLNGFQVAMMVVIVVNMVQAVSPMVTKVKRIQNVLHPWAVVMLEETVVDTVWYLTLLVGLIWVGVIAAVASALFAGDPEMSTAWRIFTIVAVVLAASTITINPGMFVLAIWGLVWLIPTALAFVSRTAFDLLTRLMNRMSIGLRGMVREWHSHVRKNTAGSCGVGGFLLLVLQVVPMTPLLLLFLPLPLGYLMCWMLHILLRALLVLSDAIIWPVSPFCLYPLLSDPGSVTWRMAALDMDVERRSMRTMLKRRVSTLLEMGKLGKLVRMNVFPQTFKPYSHLRCSQTPRLGCATILLELDEEGGQDLKMLKICHDNSGDVRRRQRERSRSNLSEVSNVETPVHSLRHNFAMSQRENY